jgi:hypothetical protein
MSIVVFEDKTRFVPSIYIDGVSMLDISYVVHNLYDPDIYDYEIHKILEGTPNISMYNALKNSNIIDSSGYFYRLGGVML